jgi:hypothetical protein
MDTKIRKIKYLGAVGIIQLIVTALVVLLALNSPREFSIFIVMASLPVGMLTVMFATKRVRKRINI